MSWKDRATKVDHVATLPKTGSWRDRAVPVQEPKEDTEEVDSSLLQSAGETAYDGMLGLTDGMTFGLASEAGAVGATGLEYLLDGAKRITPGTDRNKLAKLEAGELSVDELPGLTPELIAKLKSKGKVEVDAIDPQEMGVAETYRDYHDSTDATFKEAQKRSPLAYGVSEIAGGMASGVAAGKALGVFGGKGLEGIKDIATNEGKLKAGIELLKRGGTSFGKAAPLLAVEGVGRSDGKLIGEELGSENQMKVLEDVKDNLKYGALGMAGMEAVTGVGAPLIKAGAKKLAKAGGDFAADSTFLQKLKKANEYGEAGINPTSKKTLVNTDVDGVGLLKQETNQARDIAKVYNDAANEIGEQILPSLDKAAERGLKFNIDETFNKAFAPISKDVDLINSISSDARGRKIFERISNATSKEIDPREAKKLIHDVQVAIEDIASRKSPTSAQEDTLKYLESFKREFDQQLKRAVPEYKTAVERFASFRKKVHETILSGDKDVADSTIFWGKTKNNKEKLTEEIKDQMRGFYTEGKAGNPIGEAFENHMTNLKKFEIEDAARMKSAGVENYTSPLKRSAAEIENEIRDTAMAAATRDSMMAVKDPRRSFKLGGIVGGLLDIGGSTALHGARFAGKLGVTGAARGVAKRGADWTRKVYNLPAEQLNETAKRMQNVSGLKTLGKALEEAVTNGDQAKKNAALFSAMQNPSAAIFFDDVEED